ncbi:MAG: hypothetical protein Fur0018_15840 [Anaerolineales bacterium]
MRRFAPVLIVSGVLLLALSGNLTRLLQVPLRPLVSAQTWVAERYNALQQFVTAPRNIAILQQRNVQLEAEVSRLQTEVIALQQQVSDTAILSTLLDFARANPEYTYKAAEVIGRDPSPFLHYVIINRGSADGLRRGMPVVTQQGLVGRIAAVTASAARVQLISDPDIRINVNITPAGTSGIIAGSLTGDITLDSVPLDANLQPGDIIMTSGLGGVYPPNLLIGQVTGVRKLDFELFQSASVQSVVDLNRLQIVLVIVNFQPVDYTPLLPTPIPPQ